MDKYQIWSLVFSGTTAFGVVLGLIISLFKFLHSQNKKVFATTSNLKISENKDVVYISMDIDIVNQTNIATSILAIELIFGKSAIPGQHIEHVIQNLLTTVDTKNITLYPFQSIGLNATKFNCPSDVFQEEAVLKIVTTQRSYKYPILCREREEELE